MAFDFTTLETPIHKILSAPGTDLTTISAKNVRRQLLREVSSITPDFLNENKKAIDVVIGRVFERVNTVQASGGSNDIETEVEDISDSESRKRKQEDGEVEDGEDEVNDDEPEEARPPKKAKKVTKTQLSHDAELARQLSDELNGRSRRTSNKPRGSTNGSAKKGSRAKKSAALVDSDDDSDNAGRKRGKSKKKSSAGGGGAAKGGFAKEYFLSEPLAAILKVEKLSRPQVVKHLWIHIKDNELQNPSNKREIMCDEGLRAVFGVDKIDMFRMNKVLGQHLHENEG